MRASLSTVKLAQTSTPATVPVVDEREARVRDHVEVYGSEKFDNFVRSWQVEFGVSAWIRRVIDSSHLPSLLDIVAALLGFVSTVVYIISTYPDYKGDPTLGTFETALTWYFVADYVIRLVTGGFTYAKSWVGILDLLTILPLFASPDFTSDGSTSVNGAAGLFIRFARSNVIAFRVIRAMRFLRVLRALRFTKFHRVISLSDNSSWTATIALILTILSVITIASALFMILETDLGPVPDDNLLFHDSFYFIALTLATIGFGDIVPVTIGGKLLVVVMMALAVVLIPLHSAKILDLASSIRKTGGVYHPQAGFSHVVCVVPADYAAKQLHEFLLCLLHSNFRDPSQRLRVVVISQSETCQLFKQTLRHSSYASMVHYISGSVHEPVDLDRIALSSAKAVFVLSRRTIANTAEMDANDVNAFLAAISLKNHSPAIPTMVQVNQIRNQAHVLCKTLKKFPNMQCICMKQRTMALLAGSCIVPALHTLVCNVLQSFDAEDETRSDAKDGAGTEWWRDYSEGSRFQTFPTVWGHYFHGWTFTEAVVELAANSTILPFAMGELTAAGNVSVQLNPADRVVHEGELVFVFATDVHHAATLPQFTKDAYVSPHRVRVMKRRLSASTPGPGPAWSPRALGLVKETSALRVKRPLNDDLGGIESALRMQDRVLLPMAFQMSLVDSPDNVAERMATTPKNVSVPVIESTTSMTGHIIVCGHIDMSVVEFVRALRTRNFPRVTPVVIVQSTALPADVSAAVGIYEQVYQLIGNLQNIDDLDRIHVRDACACVLMANPFLKGVVEQDDERRQVVRADYATIVNTLALENALDQSMDSSNTIIELLYETNLRFLRPAFTRSGTNPIDALSALEDNGKRLPPLAAADGKIYSSGMLESVTAGSFFNPHLITIVDALIYGTVRRGAGSPDVRQCVVLIQLPPDLAGKPYLTLLKFMVTRLSFLPVGLLRCKTAGPSPAPIPFVFTNPPAKTIVHADDLVYVIAAIENMQLKYPDAYTGETVTIVTSLFELGKESLSSKVHTLRPQSRQADQSNWIPSLVKRTGSVKRNLAISPNDVITYKARATRRQENDNQ